MDGRVVSWNNALWVRRLLHYIPFITKYRSFDKNNKNCCFFHIDTLNLRSVSSSDTREHMPHKCTTVQVSASKTHSAEKKGVHKMVYNN